MEYGWRMEGRRTVAEQDGAARATCDDVSSACVH